MITWQNMLIACMWNTVVFGATAYIVFGLGHSGWWFLFALLLADYYKAGKPAKKDE